MALDPTMASKYFLRGKKSVADLKNELQNHEAGRKLQKPPTPFVGVKPYGKSRSKPNAPVPVSLH